MRADPATDVWALGIIFYILLFNQYPHNAEGEGELEKKIIANEYMLPEEKDPENGRWISSECEDLLR